MLEWLALRRIAALPWPVAVAWPGGAYRPRGARVSLELRDRRLLAALATGQVGRLADAYVRGRVELIGSLRELTATAAPLVPCGACAVGVVA